MERALQTAEEKEATGGRPDITKGRADAQRERLWFLLTELSAKVWSM